MDYPEWLSAPVTRNSKYMKMTIPHEPLNELRPTLHPFCATLNRVKKKRKEKKCNKSVEAMDASYVCLLKGIPELLCNAVLMGQINLILVIA